jgi:hypothetical protein
MKSEGAEIISKRRRNVGVISAKISGNQAAASWRGLWRRKLKIIEEKWRNGVARRRHGGSIVWHGKRKQWRRKASGGNNGISIENQHQRSKISKWRISVGSQHQLWRGSAASKCESENGVMKAASALAAGSARNSWVHGKPSNNGWRILASAQYQ